MTADPSRNTSPESRETAPEDEEMNENGDENRTAEEAGTERDPLGVSVVTISADRELESDPAGNVMVTALEEAGHDIATREHIDADHDRVQSIVSRMIDRDDVDVVVTSGATSVEPSDVAIEAVEPLLEKELTAFSELFTALGYEVVGSQIVAARTIAGVADDVPIFCLPGKAPAARLGIEKIILPEMRHLVGVARAHRDESERDEAESEQDSDESEQDEGETTNDTDAESTDGDAR
ncbi:MogA/MoaB family molybdenum cofactor biosynthesis protein [Natronorubrum tibetense]|uniref:Molybdenum cofactor synthesis protein n=1 Tax=Natronorubrum tibetense GA33 TaxID=1114856 RepID=L9W097_9EURY|nr:molybdopterin-binding protein [Natronorubrum tibetense]ELY42919.1 molybdenum cofactor synthesis protein [Natronorubrum tibetense GA33]